MCDEEKKSKLLSSYYHFCQHISKKKKRKEKKNAEKKLIGDGKRTGFFFLYLGIIKEISLSAQCYLKTSTF